VTSDGEITESPDMELERSCTVLNCPSAVSGKHSAVVGLGSYKYDEEIV